MARRGTAHGMGRNGEPLAELPPPESILEALHALARERPRERWFRAETVARYLGVQGSRRLGVKASKGNWSGGMKAGIRLSPRLKAMHRQGLVHATYDREDHVWLFRAPAEGEAVERHWMMRDREPEPPVVRQPKPKKEPRHAR